MIEVEFAYELLIILLLVTRQVEHSGLIIHHP